MHIHPLWLNLNLQNILNLSAAVVCDIRLLLDDCQLSRLSLAHDNGNRSISLTLMVGNDMHIKPVSLGQTFSQKAP
jgi:hypothetical protein